MCRGVTRPNVMTQGECIARAGAYILIDDTKKSARPAVVGASRDRVCAGKASPCSTYCRRIVAIVANE